MITGVNGRNVLVDGVATPSGTLDHNHTSTAGDGGVLTNDEHDGFSDYANISTPSTPAANHLRVYANTQNGHVFPYYIDQDGSTINIARDNVLLVRNTSGSTIAAGKAVNLNGSTGNVPTINLALATIATQRHAEGITLESIANNSYGLMLVSGLAQNLDTSAFIEGNIVYLSASVAGAITTTAPSSVGAFIQQVGIVVRAHATQGEIQLNILSTANNVVFTPGSVLFAGSNGLATENNSNFFWDDTNIQLGIGTATPKSSFQVNGNIRAGFGLATSFQTTINIIGGISAADTTITVVSATGFSTAGVVKIQGELITYTGKTATTLTGCTRGRFGTTAATHANGTIVMLMPLVTAESDTSTSSIIFGAGNLYVGTSGDLFDIGSATAVALMKIGTQFTISGTNGVAYQDASATGMVMMLWDGTNAVFGTRTNAPIAFRTNNTARAYITSNQNLILDAATNSDPGAGTKTLILGDGTVPSSLASNTCGLYGNDVSGTVNVFAINEAGESRQISGYSNDVKTDTGTQNDFAYGGTEFVRLNNASDLTITGLTPGINGQIVTFISVGAGNVFFTHNDSGSTATNRLLNNVTSGPTPLAAGKGSITYRYSTASSRWVLISHNQGSWLTQTFSAGDFTANGSMTWTVASGDVVADSYFIVGRNLFLAFRYQTTTVGGTPNTLLLKTIPSTYTFLAGWDAVIFGTDNGTNTGVWCFNNASTQIGFAKLAGGNWAASTDNSKIAGCLAVPVT